MGKDKGKGGSVGGGNPNHAPQEVCIHLGLLVNIVENRNLNRTNVYCCDN